jgi:UDP-N-acetylmuramoyl-L-alanyl-D-glutamate--2,6-diaminopimelate ligase
MSDVIATLAAQGIKPKALTTDSRQVAEDSLFLAYPGEHVDGRQFIGQAIAQGATAVIWEKENFAWDVRWQTPNIAIDALRNQAGVIADSFYDHPSTKMWMIGITGTNGKTSCSHWLAQTLNALGRKTAVIGTLGNGIADSRSGALSAAINTTPDPILLHGMLADYLQQGAVSVAMEVSSHGLQQGRANGVHFDVALFTNLSRDHLDYHGDMESYAAAKKKLFEWEGLSCAVLNTDDAFGADMATGLVEAGKQVLTYGLDSGEIRGSHLMFSEQGLSMQVDTPYGQSLLNANLLGRFNAYNLLAVLATLLASEVELEQAIKVMGGIRSVSGRMQQLGGGEQPLVVVDYAHTPDALEKVLLALREQTRNQLICVFGCGGDRDSGKRPIMGEIASRLADKVIVTSDNPRHEDSHNIIKGIVAGMRGDYEVEAERHVAISHAIHAAQPGDIVLIAGKGHEDYQEIGGVKYPFSDQKVAEEALHSYQLAVLQEGKA